MVIISTSKRSVVPTNLFFAITDFYTRRKSEIRLFAILAIFVATVFMLYRITKISAKRKTKKSLDEGLSLL